MSIRIPVIVGTCFIVLAASAIGVRAAELDVSAITAEIGKLAAEKKQIDEQLKGMKVDLSVVQREIAKQDPERRRLQAERAAIEVTRQQIHSRWSCTNNVCPCGDRAACSADVASFNTRHEQNKAALAALNTKATEIATKHGANPELQARSQWIAQRIAFLQSQLAAARSSGTMQALSGAQNCIARQCQNLSGDALRQCWDNCWKAGRSATELPPVEAVPRAGTPFFGVGGRRAAEPEDIKELKPRVQHEIYRYRYPPPPPPVGPIGPAPGQEGPAQGLQSK